MPDAGRLPRDIFHPVQIGCELASLEKGAKLLRHKDQPEPFSCLIVTGTVMLNLFSPTENQLPACA